MGLELLFDVCESSIGHKFSLSIVCKIAGSLVSLETLALIFCLLKGECGFQESIFSALLDIDALFQGICTN
jgi:hypothetical protein